MKKYEECEKFNDEVEFIKYDEETNFWFNIYEGNEVFFRIDPFDKFSTGAIDLEYIDVLKNNGLKVPELFEEWFQMLIDEHKEKMKEKGEK